MSTEAESGTIGALKPMFESEHREQMKRDKEYIKAAGPSVFQIVNGPSGNLVMKQQPQIKRKYKGRVRRKTDRRKNAVLRFIHGYPVRNSNILTSPVNVKDRILMQQGVSTIHGAARQLMLQNLIQHMTVGETATVPAVVH